MFTIEISSPHRPVRFLAIGVILGILLATPSTTSAAAQLAALADGGLIEHLYNGTGKAYVDTIQFVWLPEAPPNATVYGMSGYCLHIDANTGFYVGRYTATFRKVTMVGLDSQAQFRAKNKKAKTTGGTASKYAVWDLDGVGDVYANSDSAVLVTAQVKIKGTVFPGSILQCYLAVLEGDASLVGTASTAAEREAVFEELTRLSVGPRTTKPVDRE